MFTADSGSNSIEVMVADENVWLTQDMIATLYDKGRSTVTEHLKNIFADGELEENSVCRKSRRTGSDGKEKCEASFGDEGNHVCVRGGHL